MAQASPSGLTERWRSRLSFMQFSGKEGRPRPRSSRNPLTQLIDTGAALVDDLQGIVPQGRDKEPTAFDINNEMVEAVFDA